MYVSRLRDGQKFGVFLDNGRRIAIRATEKEALRHMHRLRASGGRE